jgi:NAD(P)-dependent dehydrogenase (short-subunit alcohol dehydrogenase family)
MVRGIRSIPKPETQRRDRQLFVDKLNPTRLRSAEIDWGTKTMPEAAGGRAVLVIGGTGGIGRAIVERLVAQQANVHVLDLAPSADWSSSHSSPRSHAVDVGDEPSVDATIDAIVHDEGRLDCLVCCAGIFSTARPHAGVDRGPHAQYHDQSHRCVSLLPRRAACNARAGFRPHRPGLLARSGAVNGADYAASKGGLLGLARSLALEVASAGIRVNTVSPGVVDTAMPRAHSDDETLSAVGRSIPLGGIACADDVAEASLFLLGDDSSYLTGPDLRVNGGATLW